MKLGDVLKKEREKKSIEADVMARHLDLAPGEYQALEGGTTEAEAAGPLLAQLAIQLDAPTSRLIAASGRAADARNGQLGELVTAQRKVRQKTPEALAEALGISLADYQAIEAGKSNLELWGPRFLRFAEVIEQPVFNIFYPCGLPFQELDDYP
ncbi:MAG: hypothetical protein AAF604_15945 [Acidobacteriota bacterium]